MNLYIIKYQYEYERTKKDIRSIVVSTFACYILVNIVLSISDIVPNLHPFLWAEKNRCHHLAPPTIDLILAVRFCGYPFVYSKS